MRFTIQERAIMDTRTKIVETASRLFFTQGYNLTGINQIIEEAGIAKATLYQHFRSKEEVLIAYIHETATTMNEQLSYTIQNKSTAKEKILAIFEFLLRGARSCDYKGCNFLNIASQVPQDNKKIAEMVKQQKDLTRRMFVQILTPIEKSDVADEIYLLYEGALAASRIYRADWPIHCAQKVIEKLI